MTTKRIILTALLIIGLSSGCTWQQIDTWNGRLPEGSPLRIPNPDAPPASDTDMCEIEPETCGAPTGHAEGDDNGDGRIDEDESGWDCHTMGNHICGPGGSDN